jgi:hypothetical protein
MSCQGTNVSGEPCKAPVVGADGFCAAHREGGVERLREQASQGGKASTAKYATEGFRADELPALTDHASVKASIGVAMTAHAERRITHHELGAHTKACETWLKVDSAQVTKQLVNDTQKELERAKREIESLRRQLADRGRAFKGGPKAVPA